MITSDDIVPVLVPLTPGTDRATCTGCVLARAHAPVNNRDWNLTQLCGRLGCGTTAIGYRIIYQEKQK